MIWKKKSQTTSFEYNNAPLPNKYIRFIKWKFHQIKAKFQRKIYVEVFLNSEGHSPKIYISNIRLGVAGKNLIIQNKSEDLKEVFRKYLKVVYVSLAKDKAKKSA